MNKKFLEDLLTYLVMGVNRPILRLKPVRFQILADGVIAIESENASDGIDVYFDKTKWSFFNEARWAPYAFPPDLNGSAVGMLPGFLISGQLENIKESVRHELVSKDHLMDSELGEIWIYSPANLILAFSAEFV